MHAHELLLNLVFFLPATSGVLAVVLLWRRILRTGSPPPPPDLDGGSRVTVPSAGPDDLARSA